MVLTSIENVARGLSLDDKENVGKVNVDGKKNVPAVASKEKTEEPLTSSRDVMVGITV